MTHGLHLHVYPSIQPTDPGTSCSVKISIVCAVCKSLKSATCAIKSAGSGSTRVSTHLAIGLSTHGSILICSSKNRSGPVDTFFRNSRISVPDTETQSSVNGVARGYIRERGTGLLAFTLVRLGFHSPQRSAKVSGMLHRLLGVGKKDLGQELNEDHQL